MSYGMLRIVMSLGMSVTHEVTFGNDVFHPEQDEIFRGRIVSQTT